MAARTMPANATYSVFPQVNTGNYTLTEASRAGDAFTVYSDFAIWDSTLNSYVLPERIKNTATGVVGLPQNF
jgi:hypothetical protein